MLQLGPSISPDFVWSPILLWMQEVNGVSLESTGNFTFDFHEGHIFV